MRDDRKCDSAKRGVKREVSQLMERCDGHEAGVRG